MINKLRKWVESYRYTHGREPETIPLTWAERLEVEQTLAPPVLMVKSSGVSSLFNIDIETTEHAESLRERRLRVSPSEWRTEVLAIDDNIKTCVSLGKAAFIANLLTDRTKVRVEFEWDIFAWLKRLLGMRVRTRSAVIDCSVLYPYVEVQFPHNRHTVHFSAA